MSPISLAAHYFMIAPKTMPPETDEQLLSQYVSQRCERSFRLLVERHIDMIYAAARRQLGDPAAAEDVTQAVFIVLAHGRGKFAIRGC